MAACCLLQLFSLEDGTQASLNSTTSCMTRLSNTWLHHLLSYRMTVPLLLQFVGQEARRQRVVGVPILFLAFSGLSSLCCTLFFDLFLKQSLSLAVKDLVGRGVEEKELRKPSSIVACSLPIFRHHKDDGNSPPCGPGEEGTVVLEERSLKNGPTFPAFSPFLFPLSFFPPSSHPTTVHLLRSMVVNRLQAIVESLVVGGW